MRRAFQLTGPGVARQRGLGAIPDARPMLFVGNHQTYALDIGFLVEQLVKERGIMPRGLAHPAIFAVRADVAVLQHWGGVAWVCVSDSSGIVAASAGSGWRQKGPGHAGLWQLHDDIWRRAGVWLLVACVSAYSLY